MWGGMGVKSLNVGEPAPDFELISLKGEKVRLSDFRGKNVVESYGIAEFIERYHKRLRRF